MQVSQLGLVDSHAIIGGGEARAFGMSDSAEFFTVLSDTLYRNKKLAVVREVLCNAWDAHIANGQTSIPVEIDITSTELVIRDFGPGIHDDKIANIYCVYGGSTKTADGKQTGGFGLGSKAPFAYSDHFTVTSCHDGVKSVYAISRGGVETGGRPGIRKMLSVPTTTTGITVSIPLKDAKDAAMFGLLANRVARHGGILAKQNGQIIPTIDYAEARKAGYTLIDTDELDNRESSVYVLYGTVLYPVAPSSKEGKELVRKLGSLFTDFTPVLIAPPNSVGVTPSREALSYTDATNEVLVRLMRKTINHLRDRCYSIINKVSPGLVAEHGDLLFDMHVSHMKPKGLTEEEMAIFKSADGILTYHGFCKAISKILCKRYPKFRSAIMKAAMRNDYALRDIGPIIRIRPFMRVLAKTNNLKNAFIPSVRDGSPNHGGSLRPLKTRYMLSGVEKVLDTIILAQSQKAASKAIFCNKNTLFQGNHRTVVPTIIVKRLTSEMIDQVRAEAAKMKMEIFVAQSETVARPAKPKGPKTFRTLTDVQFDYDTRKSVLVREIPGKSIRVADPKFFIPLTAGMKTSFPLTSYEALNAFRERFMDDAAEIAIATNKEEVEELQRRGVKRAMEQVLEEAEALKNERAVLFAALKPGDLSGNSYCSKEEVFAKRLADADPRLAQIIFGARFDSSKKIDQFEALALIINAYRTSASPKDNYCEDLAGRMEAAANIDIKKARKTFQSIIGKVQHADLKYLENLMKIMDSDHVRKIPKDEHYLNILTNAVKSFKRSQLAEQKTTRTLKEAA